MTGIKHIVKCSNCGKMSNSYMTLIRLDVWVCKTCVKNIESHG